jgi:hypothetical protein
MSESKVRARTDLVLQVVGGSGEFFERTAMFQGARGLLAGVLIALALMAAPAFGQGTTTKTSERKPVVEYILVVVLLGLPILLVCRSSRRMS